MTLDTQYSLKGTVNPLKWLPNLILCQFELYTYLASFGLHQLYLALYVRINKIWGGVRPHISTPPKNENPPLPKKNKKK